MFTALYGCGVIPVFPEGPFSLFSLIEFLAEAIGNQLYGFGDNIATGFIENKEVNMIAGHRKIEDNKPIPLLRLIQPLPPT
jgi:hypothetical protein